MHAVVQIRPQARKEIEQVICVDRPSLIEGA